MGAVNSYFIGCCSRPVDCPENHTKFKPGHRRNLSSTFTQISQDGAVDSQAPSCLLNINTATEDDLMTLPAINRNTARCIVDYRHQIGRFKKVEDLALVTGVGGDKLAVIRNEICVGQPAGTRLTNGTSRAIKPIPINEANVFQLMKLNGVNQRLAERIVAYRDKHGPFTDVDTLLRVKDMDTALLAALRPRLMLSTSGGSGGARASSASSGGDGESLGIAINSRPHTPLQTQKQEQGPVTPSHQRASAEIEGSPNTLSPQLTRLAQLFTASQLDLLLQFEPLRIRVQRPTTLTPAPTAENGRPVCRLATWNLDRFTVEKARHPGVREVICLTLLENGIDLVALQEVAQPEAVQMVVNELNNPVLPHVTSWFQQQRSAGGTRGQWSCCVSPQATGRMFRAQEYSAFVYNRARQIELGGSALIERPELREEQEGGDGEGGGAKDRVFTRSPFAANVKLGGAADLLIVSVHLKAAGLTKADLGRTTTEASHLRTVVRAIEDCNSGNKGVIIAGDFNLNPDNSVFDCLRDNHFTCVLPSTEPTNIGRSNHGAGTAAYDNLWLCSRARKYFADSAGVVRAGLSHPLIPALELGTGAWNGTVSDHCPVWGQFFLA